jgi:drug/metabolite transporter (DMT)-like permease
MIVLLLAILSSSVIFVIFKLFSFYKIDVFQAIVFNYFTAFTCGVLLYGSEWNSAALTIGNWPYYMVICSILFISLFILMGLSSQRNGVAMTSTANKMSMAMSMLLMIFLYGEDITLLKIVGIALAFIGVLLVSFSKETDASEKGAHWMLLVLFVGSGMLDFILNFVQKYELGVLTPSLFSAFGFGIAGCIGLSILIVQILKKKATFALRNVAAGIVLGIPNYFSIYLLMQSYTATGWTDSTVLAINNVAVVILSVLVGYFAFKENITLRKLIGLIVAISAIILIYVAGLKA